MPSRPNPVSSWSEYFASTMDKPLHPIIDRLDPLLPGTGEALELGAGVGHGVVHLLERGFHVTAVDAEPEAVAILRKRAPEAMIVEARFETLDLPDSLYDVVVAGFSLFFLMPHDFEAFWPRVVDALKPGGLFAGEFLGIRDDWVREGYLGHSEQDVRRLFEPFDIHYWEEAERAGKTSQGTQKHWHVIHVVGRKRREIISFG